MSPVCGAQPIRVLRGGSWNNDARNTRAAYRNNNRPDNFNDNNGFRLVLSPVPDDSKWLASKLTRVRRVLTSVSAAYQVNQRGRAPAEVRSFARDEAPASEIHNMARVEPRSA